MHEDLRQVLSRRRPLPLDPVAERVVMWRVFRSDEEAHTFARHIRLEPTQHLTGGMTEDSVGPLYWIGVEVDDVARWGNTKAIQMTDAFDAEDPEVQGRPFRQDSDER